MSRGFLDPPTENPADEYLGNCGPMSDLEVAKIDEIESLRRENEKLLDLYHRAQDEVVELERQIPGHATRKANVLTEEQARAVLVLHNGGLTDPEIARVLGVSPPAIRKRLRRAAR